MSGRLLEDYSVWVGTCMNIRTTIGLGHSWYLLRLLLRRIVCIREQNRLEDGYHASKLVKYSERTNWSSARGINLFAVCTRDNINVKLGFLSVSTFKLLILVWQIPTKKWATFVPVRLKKDPSSYLICLTLVAIWTVIHTFDFQGACAGDWDGQASKWLKYIYWNWKYAVEKWFCYYR